LNTSIELGTKGEEREEKKMKSKIKEFA